MITEGLFTISEIARALGCTRQNVHAQLKQVRADGEKFDKFAASKRARAWRATSLPGSLISKAAAIKDRKGFRALEDVFSSPAERFQLRDPSGRAVSLSEIAPTALDKARKLRSALQRSIAARNEAMPAAEFEARGIADYRSEFGYAITAKRWRELLNRTVERDGGFDEWERLEIYCDEAAAALRGVAPSLSRVAASHARDCELHILEDHLCSLDGVGCLTAAQRAFLWTKACDELQACCDARSNLKRKKRAVIDVLKRSGLVQCENVESLRRTLARKWDEYQSRSGSMLVDRRVTRYAAAATSLPDEDAQKLVARSLDCGGRVSQAYRELHREGELSAATTERFIANPASKSYVPKTVRREIAPKVKQLMPLHHGPREHELRGAFVRRDYSKMFAGDSYQADDCTCPVYYWEPDGSALGHRIIRGQLLLMIDERSLLALGFALHSENNYNARVIRALITRVHDGFGLPRRRFYFERGIWRESRILTGQKVDSSELSLEHTELGLREYGVQFAHAKLPRGKVIERVLGIVQNEMERLPGYVGRDESGDRFERVQRQLNEARAGHVPASKFFFSKEQWESELSQLMERYNNEPQQGRLLKGLTPLQAWNKLQSEEGLVHFGRSARYVLAHHKLKLKVQSNGITLRQSLGGGTYCGEATGEFLQQHVWVWFNPEEPDYVAITSLDGKRGPHVVPRLDEMPAIDATREQLRAARSQIEAHNGHARTTYRLISPHLGRRHCFRSLEVDNETLKQGDQLRADIESVKATRRKTRATARKVRERSRQLGIDVALVASPNEERTAQGLDLLKEALSAEEDQQS